MDRRNFDYTSCYCEENVCRLLARPELMAHETWAVAVFSPEGPVPVRRQRRGSGPESLVCWDYHVFALVDDEGGSRILDFDTELGFSTPARDYLAAAFAPDAGEAGGCRRVGDRDCHGQELLFRVMPGAEYRRRLMSDRSHMLRPDGSWSAPPPAWSAPGGCGEGSWSLGKILSPAADGPGVLLDLEGFLAFLDGLDRRRTESEEDASLGAEDPAAGLGAAGAHASGAASGGRRLRLMALRRLGRAVIIYFLCMYTMTLILDTSLQVTVEGQIIEGVNAYFASGAAIPGTGTPSERKAAMIAGLRKSYGLDRPVPVRALIRTWNIVTFKLGTVGDLTHRDSAARDVVDALGNTLILLGISTGLALVLGIFLGARMARKPGGRLDRGASLATMLFFGTPAWWVGSLLIMLFVLRFPVFRFGAVSSIPPPEGFLPRLLDRASYLVLPVLSIAFVRTWGIAYMTRTVLLPQLQEDYVMAARGRGISERRVLMGHVMGTAMPGIATAATQYVVAILGGDIVVETVFAYRGIGYLFWYSVRFNKTAAAVLSLSALVAMTTLAYAVLDIAYAYLDPRIRRPDRRKSSRG